MDRPGEAVALNADPGLTRPLWKRRQNVVTSWKIVAVFVAVALTGCATKGDLEDLRKEVAATESSAQASETHIKSIEEKLAGHENMLLSQDARLAEAEKALVLAEKRFSDAADRHAALAEAQTQMAKQLAETGARLKALDDSITKAVGQLDKDEAQIAKLNNDTKTWAADLQVVKDETVKLHAEADKTKAMYRKNLENMREIYKRQFEAVSEILEKE
jgi:chromosome segregation ATPase